MLLFQNDFLRVKHYSNKRLLHSEWLRDVTTEEIQQGIFLSAEYIKKLSCLNWILDSLLVHPLTIAEQQMIAKNIVPRLLATPVKKIARICCNDVFYHMAAENIVQKRKMVQPSSINFELFSNYNAALTWINFEG